MIVASDTRSTDSSLQFREAMANARQMHAIDLRDQDLRDVDIIFEGKDRNTIIQTYLADRDILKRHVSSLSHIVYEGSLMVVRVARPIPYMIRGLMTQIRSRRASWS